MIERSVQSHGCELISAGWGAHGLLQVVIDRPDAPQGVSLQDCENVTRQLQVALQVEGLEYRRLEVGSPGLDRPLLKPEHFRRFVGARVEVVLLEKLGGRKKFRGILQATRSRADAPGEQYAVTLDDEGDANLKAMRELCFLLEETKSVRLMPDVSFGGRKQ